MIEDEELAEACYSATVAPEVTIGDVCRAVPFIPAFSDIDLLEVAEIRRGEILVVARWAFGLVVRVEDASAVVVPISVREATSDEEEFDAVAEAGRTEASWIRLPELDGEWGSAAVAFLSNPQTVPTSFLTARRAISMTDSAREVLAARMSRAFEP
jgi:hypothetical protein